MNNPMSKKTLRVIPGLLLLGGVAISANPVHTARADDGTTDTLFCLKNPASSTCPDQGEGLSAGGMAAMFGSQDTTSDGNNNPQPGYHDNGRGGNTFVNDPCLDPPAPNRRRTVQSETEIATFGKYMVAGYNRSNGFYDNTQGLSGYAYSVNGGNTWVDGSGLPPAIPTPGVSPFAPGNDGYFGDPILVVDKSARTFNSSGTPATTQAPGVFYYSSIYKLPNGTFNIAVNRGTFQTAPPQTTESVSNTRCLNDPTQQGVPNTTNLPTERIVWEKPVVAVPGTASQANDFLDKEWLYVSQTTGELYLTYTRFGADGSTPLELVRSRDGGRTWTPPSVIVPNLDDTFNQATQPMVTATGRVIVTWIARTFSANGSGPESENRIEMTYSDNDGTTFRNPVTVVARVNPQGEPNGYNRRRRSILNAPYIAPEADGTNVYITYFSGTTPLAAPDGTVYTGPLGKSGNIFLASSHDNGNTFTSTKVNDDTGTTSHVFPSVQVNKNHFVYVGWLDRRNDSSNVLTDTWAAVSKDAGATFSPNREQTDVATSWYVRADARPNMGDYTSSELLNDNQFVMIWADGRFPPPAPAPQAATPDTIFTIANGLGDTP